MKRYFILESNEFAFDFVPLLLFLKKIWHLIYWAVVSKSPDLLNSEKKQTGKGLLPNRALRQIVAEYE